MAQHNFEELEVWKRSSRLAVSVLELSERIKSYPLRDQMVRCTISIPSNTAEGAERESEREFRRFLLIAKGSAGELRTQLYITLKANLLTADATNPLILEVKEISSMLHGLIKRISP
jgi:four helix bundle protein